MLKVTKHEAGDLCMKYLRRLATVPKDSTTDKPRDPAHAMYMQCLDQSVRDLYSADELTRREAWDLFERDDNIFDLLGIEPSVARQAIDTMMRATRAKDVPHATPS